MIPYDFTDEQRYRVFEGCLSNAIENGSPCLLSVGLSEDVTKAVNAVAKLYPSASPAQIARARLAFTDQIAASDNATQ